MAHPDPSMDTEQWLPSEKLLVAVSSGVVFLDALDASLTQVALPSIGASLHLDEAQLQWIVSAYVLGYGGFLLLGGRCADVLGRRRVLLWGLVALMAASLLGTVVSDGTLLIAARFAKGMSAAFTAPAALSILSTSFAEGPHRNRALGIYTAAAACGFTFGLVSGGLLTQLTWRATFAVVVPAAAVLLVAALRVVPGDEPAAGGRLDLGGALTVTAGALLFVRAVVEAPTAGWLSPETVVELVLAAALLAAFVALERTVAQPLVRLALLRSATLVRANVGALLLFGCATVFNVVNTLYEQDVLGWGPLKTGLVFMAASITTALLAPRIGPIATRLDPDWLLLAGGVAMLASFLAFLATGTTTSYPPIVASLVLMGAGFALAYPSLNIQALAGVADAEQGLASGLVGSSLQIGGAVLLAISTAATLAATPARAGAHELVHGLHAGMCVALAGAGLITLVTAGALVRAT
ncbi:MAG TPA: MFS transporter [Gaiellaceae bacterium]|nr:MFS transporter [Gaiellaceae bacterium]